MKLHEYYKNNKFNPTTFNISTSGKLAVHREKRDNLYINKLCIPNMIWRGARVLEAGCSSGENTLLYAQMGARLTLIEPVAESVERLRGLFNHYDMRRSIEKVYVDEIERVDIDDKYDIVVAEGFINTLEKKDMVIRKLFDCLERDGLLIVSTIDTVGSFIEYVKTAIAQIYCRKHGIDDLDLKADAVRPFFEKDFNSIPHSRLFQLWAKDGLVSPMFARNSPYNFLGIVRDLEGMEPVYYSSWPSYRHSNSLTWHKCVVSNDVALRQAVEGYNIRKISFLLGEDMGEREALKFLLDNAGKDIERKIEKVIVAIQEELFNDKPGAALDAVEKAASGFKGKIKQLFKEIALVLNNTEPKVYSRCTVLRKHWGVPYHYIVLRRN